MTGLDPDDLRRLDVRARAVGVALGWTLAVGQARNPEFVFVTAETIDEDLERHRIVVFGPDRINELTVHEIDLLLD